MLKCNDLVLTMKSKIISYDTIKYNNGRFCFVHSLYSRQYLKTILNAYSLVLRDEMIILAFLRSYDHTLDRTANYVHYQIYIVFINQVFSPYDGWNNHRVKG